MSDMQINSVLAQIRSLSTQVHGVTNNVASLNPSALKTQQAQPGSFASILMDGVGQVNQAIRPKFVRATWRPHSSAARREWSCRM
jgi:hypothetical protein